MPDTIQPRILTALLIALKPLARALLRAGIGYREFAEISKSAFVSVASKDHGLRGRPTNISRVAVMTGLTRKEVSRIRDEAPDGGLREIVRVAPMGVILHRWYTENSFIDDAGRPRELAFDGEPNSFSDLVRRFGGDIPPGAMRTELKRINAIVETGSGRVKVLKRNVSKTEVDERLVDGLSVVIYPALLALAHNTDAENPETWVMRTAATSGIRGDDLGRVRQISSGRLAEFVESIDDLFAAYETVHDNEAQETADRAIGIGVYYFEEDKTDSTFFYKA